MRRLLLTIAAAAALGGCGKGSTFDKSYVAAFREKGVAACAKSAGATSAAAMGIDVPRLCSCSIDRTMAGKSAMELMRLKPTDPAVRVAAQQCLIEQKGGEPAVPATT